MSLYRTHLLFIFLQLSGTFVNSAGGTCLVVLFKSFVVCDRFRVEYFNNWDWGLDQWLVQTKQNFFCWSPINFFCFVFVYSFFDNLKTCAGLEFFQNKRVQIQCQNRSSSQIDRVTGQNRFWNKNFDFDFDFDFSGLVAIFHGLFGLANSWTIDLYKINRFVKASSWNGLWFVNKIVYTPFISKSQ